MSTKSFDTYSLRSSLSSEKYFLRRVSIIGVCVLAIMAGHWFSPITSHSMHTIHVLLQAVFVVPAILGAAWFGLRGALMTVVMITILYVPHIVFQWAGNMSENINQYAELATVWVTALIAGTLVDREKGTLRVLAQTHEGALIALVSALDAREHQTRMHSLRVRAFAVRLAKALGLSGMDLTIVAEGALLHDIGKIGVPDGILLKDGPLDDEQWEILRRHPETGRNILSTVPILGAAIQVVYAHHEKYDGSGYPCALAGDEIPFEARIFSVADALDALVSDRPYRKGVDWSAAKEVVQKDSGSHFDPKVVAAMVLIPDEEWASIAQAAVAETCGNGTKPTISGSSGFVVLLS
jgi:putative nucleotidyltransferase with HDIG domain